MSMSMSMSASASSNLVIPYTATAISISGRIMFMYLLYTNKSRNTYSLLFCLLNMVSSSLWITYSMMIDDTPLLIRGSSDLILFTISGGYIVRNKMRATNN